MNVHNALEDGIALMEIYPGFAAQDIFVDLAHLLRLLSRTQQDFLYLKPRIYYRLKILANVLLIIIVQGILASQYRAG